LKQDHILYKGTLIELEFKEVTLQSELEVSLY